MRRLLDASRTIHRESGGAFDPTVMPLVNAWGFGYKSGTPPSRAQLDSILAYVGLEKLALHGDTLVKQDPRVMLDFSSIAKGMACDEIGRMLVRNVGQRRRRHQRQLPQVARTGRHQDFTHH